MTKRLYSNISQKNTARVFLDTNVAYDLISRRQPFYNEARFVEDLHRQGNLNILLSTGSIISILYLAYNREKIQNADAKLFKFLKKCEVLSISKPHVLNIFSSTFRDKEDAYQYFTALQSQADYFLTRDTRDFKSNKPYILPVLTPLQFEYMLL